MAQPGITRAEYAIYGRVLSDIYKENPKSYHSKSYFVVLRDTDGSQVDFEDDRKFRSLIKDFKTKNANSVVLEKKIPPAAYPGLYYLSSQSEIDELFRRGQTEVAKRREEEKKIGRYTLDICGTLSWKPFYEKYPDATGYYKLSRPGLSGLFAIVTVLKESVCSGFSRTYILKKVGTNWRIYRSFGSEWVA